MPVLNTADAPITSNRLIALHHTMRMHGDAVNAKKIADLYDKLEKNEYTISFAGHFSAGKSSMINALLARDILPKSPIPTSANIVRVTSGNGTARVYFQHAEPIEYDEPYDIDMIKEYCKNKDDIKQIDIQLKDHVIPIGKAIMDTPGIDAADDADRLITESSLHTVDALFYVMDYNHVQSEVNLHFLQQIQEMKLPFYIIINQIDKHRETELPFSAFEKSIQDTFMQWQLYPRKIFYTSLIDASASYNQFAMVKNEVSGLLNQNHQTVDRITDAAMGVADAHRQFLKDLAAENMGEEENIDQTVASEEYNNITSELDALLNKPNVVKEAFLDELNQTLKNAYLMPAALRDKAEEFLRTQQPDFKVGFFASHKKTEIARSEALQQFLTPLQETIDSAIRWRLRDKLLELMQNYDMHDEHIQQMIQGLKLDYGEKELKDQMKPGAKLNGNYLLHYTNDVAGDIKHKFKQKVIPLIEKVGEQVKSNLDKQVKSLQQQKESAGKQIQAIENQVKAQEALQYKLEALQQAIENPVVSQQEKDEMKQEMDVYNQPVEKTKAVFEKKSTSPNEQTKATESTEREKEADDSKHAIPPVLEKLDETIHLLSDIQGFQSAVDDLKMKKARLKNRTVTIALFGAFSAGKSTFANALMGKDVLPSSPNPTTAAISRISAPSSEHPHQSAVIHLKDESSLLTDLKLMLEALHPPKEISYAELLEWAKEHASNENNKLTKLQEGYILALQKGYAENKDRLGGKLTVSFEVFKEFAVNESKACYVEQIDLYYDCEMTRQGIQLVDTPGADSMNARHTNVAFDYIKYADAIIYVTYYNHALSRADKDFLMQLGRVKEAFELDKMFFTINASDLAANNDEEQMVIRYVHDQLTLLGIRFPRIFPVSSRKSLQEKLAKDAVNDEMKEFEAAFFRFIHHDLAQMQVKGALFDIRRAKHAIDGLLDAARMDDHEKQQQRTQLLKNQELMEATIGNVALETYVNRVSQKIEKQLYYIKQRFGIRFHDLFKEMFNPTTITDSGKAGKQELTLAMEHLLDYAGYELLQEVRAACLRVEKFMHETVREYGAGIDEKLRGIDSRLSLSTIDESDFQTPDLQQPFTSLTADDFKEALASFRGTKAFFVKREKEQMKDDIYQMLEAPIDQYLKHAADLLINHYHDQMEVTLKDGAQSFIDEIASYVNNNLSAMAGEMDQADLFEKQKQFKHILEREDRNE